MTKKIKWSLEIQFEQEKSVVSICLSLCGNEHSSTLFQRCIEKRVSHLENVLLKRKKKCIDVLCEKNKMANKKICFQIQLQSNNNNKKKNTPTGWIKTRTLKLNLTKIYVININWKIHIQVQLQLYIYNINGKWKREKTLVGKLCKCCNSM